MKKRKVAAITILTFFLFIGFGQTALADNPTNGDLSFKYNSSFDYDDGYTFIYTMLWDKTDNSKTYHLFAFPKDTVFSVGTDESNHYHFTSQGLSSSNAYKSVTKENGDFSSLSSLSSGFSTSYSNFSLFADGKADNTGNTYVIMKMVNASDGFKSHVKKMATVNNSMGIKSSSDGTSTETSYGGGSGGTGGTDLNMGTAFEEIGKMMNGMLDSMVPILMKALSFGVMIDVIPSMLRKMFH